MVRISVMKHVFKKQGRSSKMSALVELRKTGSIPPMILFTKSFYILFASFGY